MEMHVNKIDFKISFPYITDMGNAEANCQNLSKPDSDSLHLNPVGVQSESVKINVRKNRSVIMSSGKNVITVRRFREFEAGVNKLI
jgi:hypothetical protein